MKVVIGVIIDTSEKVSHVLSKKASSKKEKWLEHITELVKVLSTRNCITSSNKVFALGFGSKIKPEIFDVLHTVEQYNIFSTGSIKAESIDEAMNAFKEIINILEAEGVKDIKKYQSMIEESLRKNQVDTKLFHFKISKDEDFRKEVVDYLKIVLQNAYIKTAVNEFFTWFSGQNLNLKDAIIKNIKKMFLNRPFMPVSEHSVISIQKGSEIIKNLGSVQNEHNQNTQATKGSDASIREELEKYIYGNSQLKSAIIAARDLFMNEKYTRHKKCLLIISAGDETLEDFEFIEEFKLAGIKRIGFLLTTNNITDPKQLFTSVISSWDKATQSMFMMSSRIRHHKIPKSIVLQHNWTIDQQGESAYACVQISNPEIIRQAFHVLEDFYFSKDSLVWLISEISLGIYINRETKHRDPPSQEGGTCYANASAAVMHLSMKRIKGREGGYPKFEDIREDIISRFGTNGANTFSVLKEVCPNYRLHCRKIDSNKAIEAMSCFRPVIATFRLTTNEWHKFSHFFKNNRKGILTRDQLDISRRTDEDIKALSGHAVVLTSTNTKSFRFMNSWGSEWADGGFFMVTDETVLGMEFIDVFWLSSDLKQSEQVQPILEAERRIARFLSKLGLKGFATSMCKKCKTSSDQVEFIGDHLKASCPVCKQTFSPDYDLGAYLYLMNLPKSD